METRQLGGSDLRLTTVGLGTWAMGGDNWAFGWGPQDDAASVASVLEALDAGINWIDTAPVYGLGHGESVVGKAIRNRRSEITVATKCGRVWDENRQIGKCLQRESIRRECDASLKRLGIDVIDLYQIHWPEPEEEVEEGWSAVAELIEEGKVRYGGVSNFGYEQLKRAHAIYPVASIQPPYSMFRPEAEKTLFSFCRENDIGVVAYSPMQAGLLTGAFTKERAADLPETDWRKRNPYFMEPQLSVNLATIDRLQAFAVRKGWTVAQLALTWALREPVMTSTIVGARKPGQILETVKASGRSLSLDELIEVDSILAEREASLPNMDESLLRPQPRKPASST